jgi:transcription initiation factor TFIIF subunit beta
MARTPRNQLLDQLFALFRETPRWSIRPLREKTQQPEVYLKEVLAEIAFLGSTMVKEVLKDDGVRFFPSNPLILLLVIAEVEVDDVEEEDDEDDDDMEEVS